MHARLTLLFRTTAALGLLMLVVLVGASPSMAATTPWGELGHFGDNPGELHEPQQAFGVDPEDESSWVVDEGTSGEHFRIRKFEGGHLVASREFGHTEGLAKGVEGEDRVEGVAFDTKAKRAYVLVTEERTTNPENGENAAAELWAFSTSTKEEKIEFASGTKEGILVPREEGAFKGTPVGQAKFYPQDPEKSAKGTPDPTLVEPRGIAVNPTNGQIEVVGNVFGETAALWAISEKGTIEADWEDATNFFETAEVSSPVVTAAGKIYVLGLGSTDGEFTENVYEIPPGFNSKAVPARVFWVPVGKAYCEAVQREGKEVCPYVEKLTLLQASVKQEGGQMTLGPEGDLYIHVSIPDLAEGELRFGGVMVVSPTLQEIGWTGGGSSASASKACAVNETSAGGGGAALLGAGHEKVFMFEQGERKAEQQKVLELGPGGSTASCPKGTATAPTATVNGVKLSSFPLADKVVFSSEVKQANAISTEWEWEPGVVETVNKRQQEKTLAEHKFATAGTKTVVEKIHTDDLASPVVETSTKVTITAPAVRDTEALVEGTSATLKAEVNPNAQNITTCQFEYALASEKLGGAGSKVAKCPKAPGEGESFVPESVKVEGLTEGKEYRFRLVANETDGEEKTFEIRLQGAPLAETLAATGIGTESATLNGTVNPEGHEITKCQFEYGTTVVSEHVEKCATAPGSGNSPVTETLALKGLVPATGYKFRLLAESGSGKSTGAEKTFTTSAKIAPGVETGSASAVAQTTATLTGKVNPHGESTSCEFEYGTTTAYGNRAACATAPGAGNEAVGVSASISGLTAGTVYHYKLLAKNEAGTSAGADEELRTAAAPAVIKEPEGNGQVLNFIEASPIVSIAGTSVTVAANGAFTLKLSCPGGLTQCSGTATIKTLTAVATSAGHKAKKSILTLATATFTIAGGKLKVLSLHLTSKAKLLLAKDHTVRARLTVVAKNPQGMAHTSSAVLTLKAAKKKKH
jgi:hypothetical protein